MATALKAPLFKSQDNKGYEGALCNEARIVVWLKKNCIAIFFSLVEIWQLWKCEKIIFPLHFQVLEASSILKNISSKS